MGAGFPYFCTGIGKFLINPYIIVDKAGGFSYIKTNPMERHNHLITANILADSINTHGDRVTTMLLCFPRIVLSEFNTHRMLSKNSASSRAIPFKKMIKMVEEQPFVPTRWMAEHKGMQGKEYHTDPTEIGKCIKIWMDGRDAAIKFAKRLDKNKVTKQLCNRMLEPYMMHTALVTASEWENFFALRAHEDAEIHIQELAFKMLDAYNNSTPKELFAGEWHIPYGDRFDEKRLEKHMPEVGPDSLQWWDEQRDWLKVKIATARCARTSYLNNEGADDYQKDLELHDRLLINQPIHASPAEHCARAMYAEEYEKYSRTYLNDRDELVIEKGWCRNLKGFAQYRTMLSNDTAIDNRVNKNKPILKTL
jgi:thymidylate synthase ThyX